MRILYIVPYAPSLVRVRPYQLIRSLARRNHEVTVATLLSSREDEASINDLRRDNVTVRAQHLPRWRPVWNCLRTVPTRRPLQAAFSWQPGLLREVKAAFRKVPFDVVHVEHLRGSLFGLSVNRLLSQNGSAVYSRTVPVVWDSVDCISHLFEQASEQSKSLKGRLMTRMELARTRRFEGWLASQFDHVLTTSATDRDVLLRLKHPSGTNEETIASDTTISVLPNGVDLDYFTPPSDRREEATIVFTGKMSYHANVTAAEYLVNEIMPLVWARRPDVKVVLVGKNPPRSLLALESTGSTGLSGSRRGTVRVTGTVPDIRPFLRGATLSLAPLVYGAGIQNKVLEAMACATPVVTSPQAAASLSAQLGRDLMVAEDADSFSRATLELLSKPGHRETVGQAGRRFVETHHNWDEVGKDLEAVYQRVISSVNPSKEEPEVPGGESDR